MALAGIPTLVCTPLLGTTISQMLVGMQRAKDIGADLVEIRLDCLRSFNPRPDLETLIKQSPLPTLVTYNRPIWEGGKYEGDETRRLDALRLAMELGADYVDVELQVAQNFISSIYEKKPDNFRVIVSSHNFHHTPSSEAIGNLAATIQATGADIVKIVTTALDITDCARVFQITVHSQLVSGLDAFQAEKVMETLQQLAQDGHTVICSIHQPRGSVYSKFDDIVLLTEGSLVYAGPAHDEPLVYFSKFGYHCPDHVNPAEFLADLISIDYSSADSVYSSRKWIDGLVESFAQRLSTIIYATPITLDDLSKKQKENQQSDFKKEERRLVEAILVAS